MWRNVCEERELVVGEGKRMQERSGFLNRNGWSTKLMKRAHEKGIKVEHELIERGREVLKQGLEIKIMHARYNK